MGEERAMMPQGMDAMPQGVSSCTMNGKQGYGGGSSCHTHDGDQASMKAAMQKAMGDAGRSADPPKDNLIRATFPAELEIRADANKNGGMPVMDVQFARYNEWTPINSAFEGHFMERIAPKAFAKTIKENVQNMRVLFQHGKDPQIGDKVLGQIESLRDTPSGPQAKVPLFDTSYNRDLVPGLRAGSYGSSFRFKVLREDYDHNPGTSDYNPEGLPERTITEAKVMEFGPVTFPAYAGATAGVRSLTLDELSVPRMDSEDLNTLAQMLELGTDYIADQDEPEDQANVPTMEGALKQIASLVPTEIDDNELAETEDEEASAVTTDQQSRILGNKEAAPSHPPVVRRDTQSETRQSTSKEGVKMGAIEDLHARLDEIEGEQREIAAEFTGRVLDPETKERWDGLKAERIDIKAAIQEDTERRSEIAEQAKDEKHLERATGSYQRAHLKTEAPDNPFDLTEYHSRATSHDSLARLQTEGAKRAIDGMYFPHPNADGQDVSGHLERLLNADSQDKEIAQRIIVMGSPTYRSAFWKSLMKMPLSAIEQDAMIAASMLEARSVLTTNTGGVTVPIQIDPTLIPTSNGVLNPFRQVARNVTTTSYIWQGVTQAGVTFTYRAEGATMADNSPTLTARPIQPERADAFIPFSWEVGQDWGSLETELAQAIQDGKDAAEATQFSVGAGHGSNAPQGVLVGAGTVVGTTGSTALAVGDVYALEAALPPRYQSNATWLMTNAAGQKVRQLVAAAGPSQWGDSLAQGQPERLIGHPIYKASTVGTAGSALTSSAKWAIIGDFSRYVIVDRIGLGIRTIDNLFAGNTAGGLSYPVGMSGVVAFYRNSAGVVDSNAFRVGTIT